MLEILSLGAGVQSSAVLLLSLHGELPKLDAVVFSDTGWEPPEVYEWLEFLDKKCKEAGLPFYKVGRGTIRSDALTAQMAGKRVDGVRWGSMPFYTKAPGDKREGMIRRQCTSEYKLGPLRKKVREIAGLKPRQRAKGVLVRQWIGISADEATRMRDATDRWAENYYPLIFGFDRPWHREHCYRWLKANGYPRPRKSACIGCPFHSDREWREIKAHPDEWKDVVEFDRAIRKLGGMRGEVFLHRSCKPLGEVDFRTDEEKGQTNFWNQECEGMCGV